GGAIALSAEQADGEVRIVVSDTGIGIPSERLDSIFDMFTQIESQPSKSQGGLGIGLALVKGLVALHRGAVEVRSDGVGRGSEFRVRLPIRWARPFPSAQADAGVAYTRTTILVVDDNQDAASSLSTLLELMGHDVHIAYDAETAINLAGELRPHALLLDLRMPGLDGYEACRRVRSQPWGKPMRIIAVTGWGQDEDRRKSAAAGFDDHLVKPVGPETLVRLFGDMRGSPQAGSTTH
ncbi:MAG TPA: response regulator, partial [Casimicrobiaceae bacterium]|nr:response regulator [Casimicrobiaceae bacterium]